MVVDWCEKAQHYWIEQLEYYDEEQQTIFIEDVWNTKMLAEHLLEGME